MSEPRDDRAGRAPCIRGDAFLLDLRIAKQPVIAVTARDGVVTIAAKDNVVVGAGVDNVVPIGGNDEVFTGKGRDGVVPSPRDDEVVGTLFLAHLDAGIGVGRFLQDTGPCKRPLCVCLGHRDRMPLSNQRVDELLPRGNMQISAGSGMPYSVADVKPM